MELTIQQATDAEFEEILIIGWKNGKTYMQHSAISDIVRVVGALEVLKYRLQNTQDSN